MSGRGLYGDHSFHGIDAFRHRSLVKERPSAGGVVSNVWIFPIISGIWVRGNKDLPGRESLTKLQHRLHSGWHQTKLVAAQGPNDGFAGELLPPALGLAIVHDEVGIAELTSCTKVKEAIGLRPLKNQPRIWSAPMFSVTAIQARMSIVSAAVISVPQVRMQMRRSSRGSFTTSRWLVAMSVDLAERCA